jgi:hypothetical protein
MTSMVQAIVDLEERNARVVDIVKGKFGLRNKSQAVNKIIEQYEKQFLEPQVRPEFRQELMNSAKQGGYLHFEDADELRRYLALESEDRSKAREGAVKASAKGTHPSLRRPAKNR